MSSENYCDVHREGCGSFFRTNAASVIATSSASVSAVSSLSILYVIFISEMRFKSVYHRLMTSLATFDFISSLAIALTTVPMPRDVIYPYEGGRVYGTVATCEAQGFASIFGGVGSFFISLGLSVFYVSIIQFRIKDRPLKRYLEPCIHIFALASAIGFAVSKSLLLYLSKNASSTRF